MHPHELTPIRSDRVGVRLDPRALGRPVTLSYIDLKSGDVQATISLPDSFGRLGPFPIGDGPTRFRGHLAGTHLLLNQAGYYVPQTKFVDAVWQNGPPQENTVIQGLRCARASVAPGLQILQTYGWREKVLVAIPDRLLRAARNHPAYSISATGRMA